MEHFVVCVLGFCFVVLCFVLICTKKCRKAKPETTASVWEWNESLEKDTLLSTRFCPKDWTFWNYVNVLCIEKTNQ